VAVQPNGSSASTSFSLDSFLQHNNNNNGHKEARRSGSADHGRPPVSVVAGGPQDGWRKMTDPTSALWARFSEAHYSFPYSYYVS
jgi:hypothetical protein